jgi:hypothetical protein
MLLRLGRSTDAEGARARYLVEGRLTENDAAKSEFGMDVELTMVPSTTDGDGDEVVTFALQPVQPKGQGDVQPR